MSSPTIRHAFIIETETEINRKIQLLRRVCQISVGLQIILTVVTLITSWVINQPPLLSNIASFILFTLVAVISEQLARRGHIQKASWLFLSFAFIVIAVSSIPASVVTQSPMLLFLLPIGLAVTLLNTKQTVYYTILCLSYTALLFLAQEVFRLYIPDNLGRSYLLIANLVLNLIIVPIVIANFIILNRAQTRALARHNELLKQAISDLENRQTTIQEVSQNVSVVVNDLTLVAYQQVYASQEQAGVVSQVNSNMIELSKTAENITELTEQIKLAASHSALESNKIEEITTRSFEQAYKGLRAVDATIEESREVGSLYEQLLEEIHELDTKSARMRTILQLINSIAQETHLLALNAAIEASGAGQYGERFGVVAQEVKRLASRSGQAGQSVMLIIRELETITSKVVAAAQKGSNKARKLEEVAEETQSVISQLGEVVQQAQVQAGIIHQAAQQANELTDIIQISTTQQRNASREVAQVLEALATVARRELEDSKVVAASVNNLEGLASKLQVALNERTMVTTNDIIPNLKRL
jgi:methyl-accepting chemotaxis protein